jgi:hypothetical protein
MKEDEVDTFAESPELLTKRDLINFFELRSYKHLLSYQDIIESDFIDTLFEQRKIYKKQGIIAGLTATFLAWDTALSRVLLMNRFIFGVAAVKLGEYLFVEYHIDEIYNPLLYIYCKYYFINRNIN